jgi:predicted ester cyclase
MSRLLLFVALVACATPSTAQTTPAQESSMPEPTSARNKQRIKKLYEDCINPGRLELLTELVSPDYVGLNGERGPAGFREVVEGLRAGFPDIHFTIEDLIAEEDRVAVRWRWTGAHRGTFRGIPPSQKHVTNTAIAIYRLRADGIVGAWLESDRLGVLQQVGVIPAGLVPGAPAPKREPDNR